MLSKELIRGVTAEILRRAETTLPKDVKAALARAYERECGCGCECECGCEGEGNEIAKVQLEAMLENVRLAEELQRPLCQDTGLPLFFVKFGNGRGSGRNLNLSLVEIERGIIEGVKEATETIPLRPNVVNALTRVGGKGSGREGNTGRGMPSVNYKIANVAEADFDGIELTAFPKGGGSENMSAFRMLSPKPEEEAVREIKEFVLEAVVKAAGKPCPPTIVGVGVGGSADLAMFLAKAALLRPVGERNKEERVARLETELLEAVNRTGIGPMGLGGRTTALDVLVETADTHITSLPVAVNFQCWAARKASARVHSSGAVEYL